MSTPELGIVALGDRLATAIRAVLAGKARYKAWREVRAALAAWDEAQALRAPVIKDVDALVSALCETMRIRQGVYVSAESRQGFQSHVTDALALREQPAPEPVDPRPTHCPKCGSELVSFVKSPLAWVCIQYGCGQRGLVHAPTQAPGAAPEKQR